jgi:hypothetical protein
MTSSEMVEIKTPGGWAGRVLGHNLTIYIFAGALLAALLGWIPSPMTNALNSFEKVANALQSHDQKSSELRQQITDSMNYQNALLRTICRGITPANLQMQCEPRYRGYEEKKGE